MGPERRSSKAQHVCILMRPSWKLQGVWLPYSWPSLYDEEYGWCSKWRSPKEVQRRQIQCWVYLLHQDRGVVPHDVPSSSRVGVEPPPPFPGSPSEAPPQVQLPPPQAQLPTSPSQMASPPSPSPQAQLPPSPSPPTPQVVSSQTQLPTPQTKSPQAVAPVGVYP